MCRSDQANAEAPAVPKQKISVWKLDGEFYDFSEFAPIHPGGPWMVPLSEGHDVTHLFFSYHDPMAIRKLAKYKIPRDALARASEDFYDRPTRHELWSSSADTPAPPRDYHPRADPRLAECRKTLEKATGRRMRELKPPVWGWCYYLLLGALYAAAGVRWSTAPSFLSAVLFGLLGWVFAGFLQHEGSHAALSRNAWVNFAGRCAIIPWGNPRDWFIRHTVQHHPYCNTRMDPDFQTEESLVRHHPDVPWSKLHSIQAWTVHFFAPLITFVYSPDATVKSLWLRSPRWGESVLYLLGVIAIFGGHFAVHRDVFLMLLPHFSFGFSFLTVTQWSHLQEECVTAVLLDAPPGEDFLGHQSRTCLDYAHGRFVTTVCSIWLNYQTYHHLFPGVSHFHFFNPRVKRQIDACLVKHGIPVPTGDRSAVSVVAGYVQYLRKLQLKDYARIRTRTQVR